jgi:hypothetical protein
MTRVKRFTLPVLSLLLFSTMAVATPNHDYACPTITNVTEVNGEAWVEVRLWSHLGDINGVHIGYRKWITMAAYDASCTS